MAVTTFHTPLTQIDEARLDALVANGVREGRQLDYKEDLPGGSDEQKREFLSDITSFANAIGGDLIFGISERRDAEKKATGEPDSICGLPGLNVDAVRLRLENMMRDGIAPRLPRVSFHGIGRGAAPSCLLLRVPRSFSGLHMVTFNNYSRFFSRNSAGKYQLDVTEIRSGFLAAGSAHDRVRSFRSERIAKILGRETPVRLSDGPKVILHGLPLIPSTDAWARFGSLNEAQIIPALRPLGAYGSSWRFNLDGFVVFDMKRDSSIHTYTQLFPDGSIESVASGLIRFGQGSDRGFYGTQVEQHVVRAFTAYQQAWNLMGVDPPIVVGLVVSNVEGSNILTNEWDRQGELKRRSIAMSS